MKSTKVLLLAAVVLILVCINPSTAAVPGAKFNGTPVIGPAPLSVIFTDQSTGSPTCWAWFFGDENYMASWTEMNESSGWSSRRGHTSVAMPDGSIVLMGGFSGGGYVSYNDTWRSTDNGATWMLMNASSGWSERFGHSSAVMPDGGIVLMGGCYIDGPCYNDTWRSIDNGSTWMLMNASAGWSPRGGHTSVVMPDGSIVLMGGYSTGPYSNDVWRSFDNGTTWTLVNASAGWHPRGGHSSVVMPDSSIVLMGGDGPLNNETWTSIDNGATWTKMNSSSGWAIRYSHTSVAIPDGSIVLMGGLGLPGGVVPKLMNDTWRSTDNGKTWNLINASSGWPERWGHTSVVMPDGSIVLLGGLMNDTWRLTTSGSSSQNPSHIYTKPGIYNVALQVYNTSGYNSTRKVGYITVNPPVLSDIVGVFRPSTHMFYLRSAAYPAIPVDVINWGASTDLPVTGNWNEYGNNVGVFRPSTHTFYIRSIFSRDFQIIVFNEAINWGISTDLPVTGDWNGDGKTEVGVYQPSTHMFYLRNGSTTWTTTAINWGISTDLPVTGDWNGDGKTEVGVYRPSAHMFYLKNGTALSWTTTAINWGVSTDLPVTGDWNGDGITDVGIYRPSVHTFYLKNGTALSWTTTAINWGVSTDLPVIGKW